MDMRALLNLFESDDDSPDERLVPNDLAAALEVITEYIQHHGSTDEELLQAGLVLRQHGYVDTPPKLLYRGLWHTITPEDRAKFKTIGALYKAKYAKGQGFRMGGGQSFTAKESVAHGAIHFGMYHFLSKIPTMHPQTPLASLNEAHSCIGVVYAVHADASRAVFSSESLIQFINRNFDDEEWQDKIEEACYAWEEDGEDEFYVNTDSGVQIVGVTLYEYDENA